MNRGKHRHFGNQSSRMTVEQKMNIANQGIAFFNQDKFEEAARSFAEAIAVMPGLATLHYNLGTSLAKLGKFERAIVSFEKAVSIKPDYFDAHFSEGLARLTIGDFANGWEKYEWRTKVIKEIQREFTQPKWRGEELTGRTILLYAEQGIGDTIQFCRYVTKVADRGGRIVLEVSRSLLRLFDGLPRVDVLIARGDQLPKFDVQCSLMSLPHVFGTLKDSVPVAQKYLQAPESLIQSWGQRLASVDGPAKVGVAWSGNPTFKNDSIRSIKLDVFSSVLRHEKCKFFSLQKEVRQTDIEALHSLCTLNNIAQDFTDFCDTAAAIMNLDLVITVDTAVAHLAGALGKPVWIMLPFDSDYRWLRGCNDSMWYPSARLFRQPSAGDWASVFEEIKIALDDFSERR